MDACEDAALWPLPQTPYEVLGVAAAAPLSDVRAAFRRLALRWHPDKNAADPAGAAARFAAVRAAAELLQDPQRRAQYDAARSQAAAHVSATVDLADFDDAAVIAPGAAAGDGRPTALVAFTHGCRCGGTYEVPCLCDAETLEPLEWHSGRRAACDCCSLVIEVTCEP